MRTNNAVADWNAKRISIIGKQQPDVFLLVLKLKWEAGLVSWHLKPKVLGQPDQKQETNAYVKQDQRLESIMEQYDKSDDLYKCGRAFTCINTLQCVLMLHCGTEIYSLQLLYINMN
jgi:hypothetical protein